MRWRRALGGILGMLWLAGSAGAENPSAAYVTMDFTTMSGLRGVTSGEGATRLGATGGGDPRYVAFVRSGVQKILYREYQTGDAPDTVTIFDPTNWATPEANTTLGKNIGGAAVSGTFLFLANYYNDGDHSYLTKHDMTDPQYRQVDARNLDDGDETNFSEYVKDVLAWKGEIYALVERRDNVYPPHYAPSTLVRFNANLDETGSVDLGQNASTMTLEKDTIYVAVIGGPRDVAGGDTALVAVDPATMAKTVLGTSRDLPAPYAFDHVGVASDGTIFVTGYNNSAETWPNPSKLFTAAPGTPRTFVDRGTQEGWVSKGVWDPSGEVFWVVNHGSGRGDSVLEAYNTAGNRVLRIPEATLGGAVYDAVPLAAAAPTQAPSGGSGGGGCAAGALPAPLALLLLAPALLLRRPW